MSEQTSEVSDETQPNGAEPAADEAQQTVAQEMVVRHRRAPRYGRFVTFGLLLAGVISFALAILTRGWSDLTPSNFFWLLMISLGPLLMLGGAFVAYLADRKSLSRMAKQGE